MKMARDVVTSIIHDLLPFGKAIGLKAAELLPTLHRIASRFTAMCFDETWVRKSAGCTGIMIRTSTPEVGEKWTHASEIDIVGTLLHVLKDMPHDPPRNVSEIIDDLTHLLRITNTPNPNRMEVDGPTPL